MTERPTIVTFTAEPKNVTATTETPAGLEEQPDRLSLVPLDPEDVLRAMLATPPAKDQD